jgi:predicted Zn-dependent protease
VVAILVHDFADFGLEVLGVALPTAMVMGICAGRRQISLDAQGSGGDRSPSTDALPAVPAWRRFLPGSKALARIAAVFVVAGAVGLVGVAAWAAGRTADADATRIRAAIAGKDTGTEALLEQAIARHPADYDFALLAARWEMRQPRPSPKALRQLNRAQRLYPAAYAPHVFTAHLLVQLGRPSQAAIELRMANELGANLNYAQMERLVGAVQLERTIPREPESLFNLAAYLISAGRFAQARTATARAVFFADSAEPSLARQMEIALASQDKAFIGEAATALAAVASTSPSFELALRGFAVAGKLEAARALMRKLVAAVPHEGGLIIRGARILAQNGDPATARALLAESAMRGLEFPDRIAGEQLLAEIAEKEGDVHGAAAARARARILAQMRKDTLEGAQGTGSGP